ncbi:MAG: site-2 protease family protein [Chloroflexi bacterium]|nr:site-2 protease family protein [Chloroflexota bacterium]
MTQPLFNTPDQLNPLIERVLAIESLTWGAAGERYLVRYEGRLRKDSAAAYDELAEALLPHRLTPAFREEGGRHIVLLINGIIEPAASNPWVNLALALLTLVSLLLAGAIYGYDGPPPPPGLLDTLTLLLPRLATGWPFALSMLGILMAHEFGHYLAARYHKTAVTLPYFLPLPFSPLGTLGAFIQLKAPPRNKRVLHDIGIAGPLAGFIVTVPILIYGLATSEVGSIPAHIPAGSGLTLEGNSVFYLALKYLVHGEWLPAPASYGGLPPALHWLRYVLTGLPTPLGGRDVLLNQVAWAGWAGLLVTGLNLIPAGQLDGGHMLYVLFGRNASKAVPFILVTLGLLGLVWPGWWLWAGLIFLFGRAHAEPLDQITELDGTRTALALLALLLFLLLFMPVPLRAIVG